MGPVPTQRPPGQGRTSDPKEGGRGGGEGGAGLSDVSMSNANRETSWSTRHAAANRETGMWPRRPPTETNKDPAAGGAGSPLAKAGRDSPGYPGGAEGRVALR